MSQNKLAQAALWGVRLLSAIAIGLSGYLLYVSLTTTPVAGCGWSSFDCDSALASHWAKWFGLPVAAGGLLTYALGFTGSLLIAGRSPSVTALGWRLLEASLPLAAGSALWFVGVQLFALESFCIYCLLTHVCGLVIAGLVVAMRLTTDHIERPAPAIGVVGVSGVAPISDSQEADGRVGPPTLGLPTAAGVFGVIALIAGQVFGPVAAPVQTSIEANELVDVLSFDEGPSQPVATGAQLSSGAGGPDPAAPASQAKPSSAENPERRKPRRRKNGQRYVTLLNGSLTIDAYDNPVLGSPDAEHVVVELMDYACPHCREFHELLEEALERYNGQVAVVVVPVPGEVLCNPYVRKSRPKSRGACNIAKVSLASAILNPEAFPEVHHWLLQGDRLPVYTSALIEAQRYTDDRQLSKAIRDESGDIKARIERNVKLMAALQKYGRIGLPTQIFPGRVVTGPSKSVGELCELWANEFGVAKPIDSKPLPF